MEFDKSICSNLPIARHKEWLETNGLGGFASSTIVGMNTRRYHGLLVSATRPPVGRMVLLSKLEETLFVGNRAYDSSVNQYPDVIHPTGHLRQTGFRLDPLPTFVYGVEDLILEKCVFMIHGADATAIRYRIRGAVRPDVFLQIKPLLAFRDYHQLTMANPMLDQELLQGPGWVAVRPYVDLPTLYMNYDDGRILPGGSWYRNFQYEEERARGLDWAEDLFNPFGLQFDLSDRPVSLIASTARWDATQVEKLETAEIKRRRRLVAGRVNFAGLVHPLLSAADQFLVRRGEEMNTVIAGYPWFTDWGRDTMIAFQGLVLVPGRYDEARRILRAFAQHCDRGMLPNRFPDGGEDPEYNTVDATLWFFQAIYAYCLYTGDYAYVREHLYATLLDIMHWHFAGTRFNIKVDEDGLLHAGEPGVQLTWMDARVDQEVVTPRMGKPVEIQALWFNALKVMEHFSHRFGEQDHAKRFARKAVQARRSFNQKFWSAQGKSLFDCITDGRPDASMRPNQIFAVSLPFSMLSRARMKLVVEAVTQHLLTPFGLRSLSPKDPRYQGVYAGGQERRDRAYHQGTVWAWLMGPYVTALVRASGSAKHARATAASLLVRLREHLTDAGLGTVSEIFDGDEPHTPRGCIAQAWSVGELLRITIEDLAEPGPKRDISGRADPIRSTSARRRAG